MTREEWIKEKEQLGWEYSCLLDEEADLRRKREELAERSEQLNAHEPQESYGDLTDHKGDPILPAPGRR